MSVKQAQTNSRYERMYGYGTVSRDAVLLVLATSMSDSEKVAYLRAWCSDETPEPPQRPAGTDWTKLPTYCLPGDAR